VGPVGGGRGRPRFTGKAKVKRQKSKNGRKQNIENPNSKPYSSISKQATAAAVVILCQKNIGNLRIFHTFSEKSIDEAERGAYNALVEPG
jgi:hypothetical protein